ncbi:MAG: T9SS type A sorting domain-containing protein [Bacteroidota bacterium]|nr:MAG: T9SS type A sorting domain-containing protein [Bacteroidota bacterium]
MNYSLAPNGVQVTGALVDIDRIFLQFTTKGEGGDVNMNSWNRQRYIAWIGEFDTVANLKGCKTIDGGAGFFGRSIFKYNNNLYWDVLCGNNETNLYRCDTSVVYDFLMGLTLTPLGLENVTTRNSTLIVYPNPANNILYLQLNANIFLENSMFYQILGVDGQIYYSGELQPDQNNHAQIDIGQLDTGWYILKTKLNKSEIRTTFSKL